MRRLKAFSLIELSVVILITGILISGFTIYKDFVNKAKLLTLRSLTRSAPVQDIPNLVLWYETTLQESFLESEAVDQQIITLWNDIKDPKNGPLINSTGSASNTQAIYTANAFGNGVAGIKFTGVANSIKVTSSQIDLHSNAVTMIAVARRTGSNDNMLALVKTGEADHNSRGGFLFDMRYNIERCSVYSYSPVGGGNGFQSGSIANDTTLISTELGEQCRGLNENYIFTTVFDGFDNFTYVNGQVFPSVDTRTDIFETATLYIGSRQAYNTAFNGYIGEIILYNRGLKHSEREQIEQYLAKKYDIALE